MNGHKDERINRLITELTDALCLHERATGIENILIVRDKTGFGFRAVSGKPNIPDNIPDENLLQIVR
ncbi:hypothetical protein KAU43_03695 [candidate division WOR-3 bacterium]|nr:hypothetical protein [candidate division WOR-3 bacterium]